MDEKLKKPELKEQLLKTTCAIILNKDKKVILIERENGKWALPSGIGFSKPKYSLSPNQAVCKEVGADLGTESFKGKRLFSIPVKDSKTTDEVIVFVGEINESEIQAKKKIKWVSLQEAISEKLAFIEHTKALQEYLASLK